MNNSLENSISTNDLLREFNWYDNSFPAVVQNVFNDFFTDLFDLKFLSLSKNINFLLDEDSYFVTKIKVTKDYDIFFRLNDKAIEIILNCALGKSKAKFDINKLTALEAKIVTNFNYLMFNSIQKIVNEPDKAELKRNNFDAIHLTFIIKDKDIYNNKTGKFIITVPQNLIKADKVTSSGEKFDDMNFPDLQLAASVLIGKTNFTLYDLKHLEVEDVIVFENSNLEHIQLRIKEDIIDVNINPNMEILISDLDNGGDEMGEINKNIWDSISVEMNAEFDSVKLTLGELKNIENGLVVDLASLYENNVTLKVEDKPIATGTLVIVNDRYGVKINNVLTIGENSPIDSIANQQFDEEEKSENEIPQENVNMNEEENNENSGEEEFDYSDFELDDENS